tara:strand:- start:260 stop:499 length:240 start_codon:yes stop_codon:yes gene_type:complete
MSNGNQSINVVRGASNEPLDKDDIFDDMATGLTKREHFAGLAMQGLLANGSGIIPRNQIARLSTECADALLGALDKPIT